MTQLRVEIVTGRQWCRLRDAAARLREQAAAQRPVDGDGARRIVAPPAGWLAVAIGHVDGIRLVTQVEGFARQIAPAGIGREVRADALGIVR
jgi:hypothetical protein